MTRPMSIDMDDDRSARELLASYQEDFHTSIADMQKTPKGRHQLNLLCKSLEKRFAPLVEAASNLNRNMGNVAAEVLDFCTDLG